MIQNASSSTSSSTSNFNSTTMSENSIANKIFVINVGGTKFTTTTNTLLKTGHSLFEIFLSGRYNNENSWIKDKDGDLFFDRDPILFRGILYFLRNEKLPEIPPEGRTKEELIDELVHYGLADVERFENEISEEKITTQLNLHPSVYAIVFNAYEYICRSTQQKTSNRHSFMYTVTQPSLRFTSSQKDFGYISSSKYIKFVEESASSVWDFQGKDLKGIEKSHYLWKRKFFGSDFHWAMFNYLFKKPFRDFTDTKKIKYFENKTHPNKYVLTNIYVEKHLGIKFTFRSLKSFK